MKVNVGDDGDGHLRQNFLQRLGVFLFGNCDTDDVGAGGGELVNLGDALVDLMRVARGHGLDGDGGVAADGDETVALIAEGDFAGGAAGMHQVSESYNNR